MWEQFLSFCQHTLVGGYPISVVLSGCEIGGLLALGCLLVHSTRNGLIYRNELVILPTWFLGFAVAVGIYEITPLWAPFLVFLQVGTTAFAIWAFRRRKRFVN